MNIFTRSGDRPLLVNLIVCTLLASIAYFYFIRFLCSLSLFLLFGFFTFFPYPNKKIKSSSFQFFVCLFFHYIELH